MGNVDNAVIVDSSGRFFRSAFLKDGAARVKWAAEYPDAALYTWAEAQRLAGRLKDAGFKVRIVLNYGMANEAFHDF